VKLFYSAASPFVRKVMACAIARDLVERIELIPTVANQSPPALLAANPLSKVPCMVTADGVALFDSPVICEYMDGLEGTLQLFPGHGGARLRALILQALGDGIMDAAVLRRGESLRPAEAARAANMARQKAAIDRSLMVLEGEPPHQSVDIGSIAIGCALGYLDFRFPGDAWQTAHPRLAAWFAAFSGHPCMSRTVPRDAT
jgi:glutathione S-transferase